MVSDTRAELMAAPVDWFARIWAIFGLALFGSTWKLWTPQRLFPQVPFFEWMCGWPAWTDWVLAAGIFGSLLLCLISRARVAKAARVAFLVFVLVSVLLDQHRLQPWVCNLCIVAWFLGFDERETAKGCLRWITISIYFYAGISKLDYQFVNSLGQEFVAAMFSLLNLEIVDWSPEHRQILAMALPVVEILVGLLLCFRNARYWSVPLACLFHAGLITVLGPAGLNHKPAVIIWNLFFIVQLVYLFWPPFNPRVGKISAFAGSRPAANFVCLLILLIPATSFVGICDHWPAWELYAPRSGRVKLELFVVPEGLKRFAVEDKLPAEIDIDRMSLELLNVPVYPQDRFQIGVVLGLAQQFNFAGRSRVTVYGESNRFTGERRTTIISDETKLLQRAETFSLNALPRKHPR